MSSVQLQTVRRHIKQGVTPDGVAGKEALKSWGAKGFTTFEDGGSVGVKLSVNAPKFKGTVKIRGDGPYVLTIGPKKYFGVKAEQLTAVIDAVVAHPTAEVEEVAA